ncbi:MAG: transposase family protein [Runella sp.]
MSKLYSGSVHDFTIFKNELKTVLLDNKALFLRLWVDLGFVGIVKNLKENSERYDIQIPHKNTKKYPLTEQQKLGNQQQSSCRVVVENAIGNQKRYFILRNENRSADMIKIQEEVLLCAGLANFKTIYKNK